MDNITATVDTAEIQKKANEFAMKGAISAIENFYTGYDSPYKKAITESLKGKEVDATFFSLPDIIAAINDGLTKEIDRIANTAIAQTFIPMVSKFLTRQEKEGKFSDVLKEFIETAKYNATDAPEDFDCQVEKDRIHGWLNVKISDSEREYTFTLHQTYESKNEPDAKAKYHLLSLPSTYKTEHLKMKLSIDGVTLELPFMRDILSDKFVSSMAGYIISDTNITMDTENFDEDLFPERCHC
jgi:hypothetical protein